MANRWYNQFVRTPHNYRVDLDCNFVVDSTNGNGLGIRSLKGSGIANVFMNTSAAFTATYNNSVNLTGIPGGTGSLVVGMPIQGTGIPALATIASIVSSSAITISAATTGGATTGSVTYQAIGSPNPEAGYILVQFTDNFYRYFGGYAGFVSPVSGTPILVTTGVTAGLAYVIVSVGTTTTAQWNKLGVPVGTTPAVGVAFVAPVTTTATGSGAIEVPKVGGSGIDHIEVIGDPNQTLQTSGANVLGIGGGAYQVAAAMFEGALTAPNNGTAIGLFFSFSNTMIKVQGE